MVTTPEALRGVRVLVVEDETLIAEELRERLTRLGVAVVGVVDTGPRAIQAAAREAPDLILMDIRLKGPLDGIQAADAIAREVAVPVVFVTAHSDQETLRRAKGTGPFGYLVKPFQERDLVITIELALDRHGLERRLRESERRYAATLASIGDGVVATDPDGRVTFVNPVAEGLTGWPAAEARGAAVEDVLPLVAEATGGARESPAREALRHGRVVHLAEPVALRPRHGDAIPIDDSAAPITDDRGKVLGAVVAFRDARPRRAADAALRRAEEQLRQSQKMEAVGRLAGGVAHDFNNLLTVIIGFADLLGGSDRVDAPARDLADQIRRAGVRAADLTRQLLAFSRKQVLQPAAVDLGRLVDDLARMLRRLVGEDVALEARADPGLWAVWADPGQLEQVVLNLAVNARDAMPRGGRLTITAANAELTEARVQAPPGTGPRRYVALTVADTGVGMDRATRERAFEPFFTTKEVGKGTGLGLATVYGIVQQSGGLVEVESEVGRGSTFRVYLPALPGPAAAPAAADPAPARGAEDVLLVEDDPAVRGLVAAALRHHGYEVHEAATGAEAVALFAGLADRVRLVVTDVVMPGMSGREVLDRVRAVNPGVRALFVSGYADDAVLRHGVHAGGVAFLPKPFSLAALARKVRETLDRPPGSAPG